MKHIKKFNESQSDIEYHKQVIKDIFQDVFDEYLIEESGPDISFSEYGLLYNLDANDDCITLYIRKYDEEHKISDISYINYSNQVERLRSMGYNVKNVSSRHNHPNKQIILEIKHETY